MKWVRWIFLIVSAWGLCATAQAAPTYFVQISDTHLGRGGTDATRAAIASINTLPMPIACVVHTGDIVGDTLADPQAVAHAKRLLASLTPPLICVPGNHDSPRIMAEMLGRPPFYFCGTRAYGNWRLIMLDSAVRWDDGGRLETTQLKILETTLAANRAQHTLIGLHHHPLPTGSHWLDGLCLRNSDEFLAIIDRFEQVRAVAWGHVHQASERTHNGVLMLSTPSTGSQFLPGSDVFMMDSRPPGYRWIELFPDGSIETEVVWLS